MTNKEWMQLTLAHVETGAVPYNPMFCPTARKRLEAWYGTGDLIDFLDLPMRMGGVVSIKPLYADPAVYGPTITDEHGVVWTTNPIDRGAPIGPVLREPDLSCYTFPDPTAPYRFEGLSAWCEENKEHFTVLWVGDLWERATFMRGMEELLLDVALHRAFVEELLERLTENILRTMEIYFASGDFDGIAVSDDYGVQRSLIISPDDWRALVKPRLARIYGLGKAHGKVVFHHSCGHIVPIIPDMIDIGLDILHPIQPEAMDIHLLKREFGKALTFSGGLRTQDLLPTATPEEVRAEVRMLKRTMGAGGGYILEAGITIQDDVPTENLVALVEEARARD